ncbi:MAG TPA: acyl-CoA reductase, partial [Burkholderiaceae bacterium]|nr:acyl-CoA reductase [Burkholderiaceae bacterium]
MSAVEAIPVTHVVKGELVCGADTLHGRFATPTLDLDALVWPRSEPGPAFETPLSEIVDVLVALGQWLAADPQGIVEQALEHAVRAGPLPRALLEFSYANIGKPFERRSIAFQVERELGGADVLDGWREIADAPSGRPARIRAFPPRLIHVVAGNAPGVSAQTVLRGALTKGVNLLKLPSNDLFTAPAILRGLAAVAPGHAVTRSFSAVYWRGGDANVEGVLFRPQFFDKIVAWGGEASIRSAIKYVGPGFELVSFDPKTSISLIGREAFASNEALREVAERAAFDATLMNQQACASS